MLLLLSRLASIRRKLVSSAAPASLRLAWLLPVMTIAVAFVLAPATVAHAQGLNTGTIAGNVTDAQGSVVPNAAATLTDPAQNKVLTAKVNGKGEYVFSDVAPGTYILRVTAPTFSAYSVPEIELNAGENVRIDAKLTAGGATETVTVEAPSMTVDTRSATIATVIDKTLVENLPIDGNNVVSLAALLPGVTNVNAPTTFTSDTGGPTYNVSGSRSNQNLFLFDGLLWNNNYYNTGLNFPPPFMLQEVSVQLHNFKAQYGRNVGSVYNVLSRSGTNGIHGTLWEYIQNSALDASDYLFHNNPHLVQNQFGATISGPVVRDKLFYFLGFQDLRIAGQVIAKAATPTLAERGLIAPGVPRPCISAQFAGMNCASFVNVLSNPNLTTVAAGTSGVKNPLGASNTYAVDALSEIQSAPANPTTGFDPVACVKLLQAQTTRYLPNAEVPSVCFNPVAVTVLNDFVPLPNNFTLGQLPFAITSAKQPRNEYNGFARFDYNLGHNHTLDARTFITNTDDDTSNSSASGIGVPNYEIDNNFGGIYSGNVGDTWVVRSNMLNVARFGYKRYNYTIIPTNTTTGLALGTDLQQKGYPVLPRFEAASGRFTLGSTNSSYSYSVNDNYEIDEAFTWTKGNHVFQFGAQYLDLDYIHRYDTDPLLDAEDQNTGLSTADFIFGLPYSTTVGNTTNISAKQHAFYFYAQDDWRATSRLTINYGLRYELPFNWYQPDGQSLTFISGYRSTLFPNAPVGYAYAGEPGVSQGIYRTPTLNFAPRFGAAYDVSGNGQTVIRGGFGVFFDHLNANTVGIGQPYNYTATYSNAPGGFSNPLYQLAPVPANYTDRAHAQFSLPGSVNYADANISTPYTMSYNFGIQQKIAAATVEINYVGKLGRHQIIPYDQNPAIYDCTGAYFQSNPTLYCPAASSAAAQGPSYAARVKYPQFNYGGQGIVDNAAIATSNYNGLQIIYIQRTRKSLTTTASYTYSRSLDEQSNGATNTANVPTYNIRDNYGPSDFQATHVFNMGWILRLPRIVGGDAVERAVLNGWTFGGVYNIRTGNPFSLYVSGDRALTDSRTQRLSLIPGMNPNLPSNRHRLDKVNEWFNINAFALPAYGTNGNTSRNFLYGPAYTQINFSLRRDIPIYEQYISEFRIDAFNVFNTPNLAQPQATLSATSAINFGNIINTVGQNGAATTNGRRLQLSFILRY